MCAGGVCCTSCADEGAVGGHCFSGWAGRHGLQPDVPLGKETSNFIGLLHTQVESAAHAALMKALWADTAFLAGQGVMDYSLLVGVDSPNGALVVGIIDFLRQVCTGLSSRGYCRPCRVDHSCIVHMSACTSCFCERAGTKPLPLPHPVAICVSDCVRTCGSGGSGSDNDLRLTLVCISAVHLG